MAMTDIGAALLRALDPEIAHGLAIRALQMAPLPPARADDPILATTLAGLALPNPVGLAAGLDKNGEALHGLSRLGFGFVECGSVTPLAQPGNPKPRLFRLSEDRAIINRMGFNNAGLEAFAGRLAGRPLNAVVGANLGANKDTEDKAADYVAGLALVSPAARTRQTWELLHDAFGDVQVREDEPLYNGGSDTLRRFVEAAEDEAGCLMVVAHNPGVHLLAVEYLVESAASPSVLDRMSGGFPPGAAAIFTVDVAGRCTFEGFIQPADLAGA